MTSNYSKSMWRKYLISMLKPADERVLPNPVKAFNEASQKGYYNDMPDNQYETLMENAREESMLFHETPCASAYVLFYRAFYRLCLLDQEIGAIAEILSIAQERASSQELPFE